MDYNEKARDNKSARQKRGSRQKGRRTEGYDDFSSSLIIFWTHVTGAYSVVKDEK